MPECDKNMPETIVINFHCRERQSILRRRKTRLRDKTEPPGTINLKYIWGGGSPEGVLPAPIREKENEAWRIWKIWNVWTMRN